MKQIIIAVLAVVAIIGGAVVFGKDKESSGQLSNYVYGKADSSVKLIEYGDFECPACGFFYPIISQVKEKYKNQISFQYKHFPLVQAHQNATAAHRAAEAAGRQGKFWEMYDYLYGKQEDWNGPSSRDPAGTSTENAIKIFEQYAQEIGLNMDQYRADVLASSTVGTINADTTEGKNSYKVDSTPTFILNGKKIEDSTTIDSVEELSKLIDEALGIKSEDTATSESTDTQAEQPTGDSNKQETSTDTSQAEE